MERMMIHEIPGFSFGQVQDLAAGTGCTDVYKRQYKYRNREFWCRGYYVDTAGKNAKRIEEYIRHQLDEDKAGEQLTMGNF